MNSKRAYYGMLAIAVLLVGSLIGGAYGAGKLLQSRAHQLADNRLRTAVLAGQEQELAKARQDITRYRSLAAIAGSVVPQDKDQAQAVRQIVDIAHSKAISLSSITFPNSSLGGGPATSTSSSRLSQLTPVKGIPGVYDLQLTVQSDSNAPVPYDQFIGFLNALEHNRRTALISSITLQPDDKNRSLLSFTLVLDEYIKP